MPPVTEVPTTIPVGYLLFAIFGLCSVIGVLFWQLVSSKRETIDLAREVIPVATTLHTTVESLVKLVERLERKLGA